MFFVEVEIGASILVPTIFDDNMDDTQDIFPPTLICTVEERMELSGMLLLSSFFFLNTHLLLGRIMQAFSKRSASPTISPLALEFM